MIKGAAETLYDVFLSHSPGSDADELALVRSAFSASGLKVFEAAEVGLGESVEDRVWSALAVSDAVVVLASPATLASSWTAVEIGAAQSWQKPVFVLQAIPAIPMPNFLASFQALPLSRLDDVIQAIRSGRASTPEHELDLLRRVYAEMHIPADRLIAEPSMLESFANRFNEMNHSSYSPEVLAHRMLTLRKSGRL